MGSWGYSVKTAQAVIAVKKFSDAANQFVKIAIRGMAGSQKQKRQQAGKPLPSNAPANTSQPTSGSPLPYDFAPQSSSQGAATGPYDLKPTVPTIPVQSGPRPQATNTATTPPVDTNNMSPQGQIIHQSLSQLALSMQSMSQALQSIAPILQQKQRYHQQIVGDFQKVRSIFSQLMNDEMVKSSPVSQALSAWWKDFQSKVTFQRANPAQTANLVSQYSQKLIQLTSNAQYFTDDAGMQGGAEGVLGHLPQTSLSDGTIPQQRAASVGRQLWMMRFAQESR